MNRQGDSTGGVKDESFADADDKFPFEIVFEEIEPADPADVAELIGEIPDPELPAVTIGDLGMVREVDIDPVEGCARVKISPTYTGCPANALIIQLVHERLIRLGYQPEVEKALSPPWRTDWITDAGRRKLRAAGIAPPGKGEGPPALFAPTPVDCVHCGSDNTQRISEFGATPCKALYRCESCLEPFEYFKCL